VENKKTEGDKKSEGDKEYELQSGSKCIEITLNKEQAIVATCNGKTSQPAASMQLNKMLTPRLTAVSYYEVKIMEKDPKTILSIGLGLESFPATELPGSVKDSFGFGCDGKKSDNGNSSSIGHEFTVNDVIGCGFNTSSGVIFFTKNGSLLGIAFRNLPLDLKLRPTIGIKGPAVVELNFCTRPLAFTPTGAEEAAEEEIGFADDGDAAADDESGDEIIEKKKGGSHIISPTTGSSAAALNAAAKQLNVSQPAKKK